MRGLYITSLILLIVGGINWGLVGLFNFNLVTALFGVNSALTNLVYILVGAAGIVGLVSLAAETSEGRTMQSVR